jgi:hypothetical protein
MDCRAIGCTRQRQVTPLEEEIARTVPMKAILHPPSIERRSVLDERAELVGIERVEVCDIPFAVDRDVGIVAFQEKRDSLHRRRSVDDLNVDRYAHGVRQSCDSRGVCPWALVRATGVSHMRGSSSCVPDARH